MLPCWVPCTVHGASRESPESPNIVLIFCDDLGYGDIGPFGARSHSTPYLDRMAAEGLRMTQFYSSSSVCTPSRSSLLTGCYAQRVNMHVDHQNLCVLFPGGKKGLHPDEITLAELLKQQGYATACIGKWHLGDQPPFLPTRQGFDLFFGLPYSNDMGERKNTSRPPLPLMRGEGVVEAPVDQTNLTERYTQECIRFLRDHPRQPVFIYLPHTFPHVPLYASERFKGQSFNGLYGDVIEELDASVGTILQHIRESQQENHRSTLVIFTSDNGATAGRGRSNGPLRGYKGSTWEGGMREPFIAWWPGVIPAGTQSDALSATMDLFPTLAFLAKASVPEDRVIDGRNLWSVWHEPGKHHPSPRKTFCYYQMQQLQAIRDHRWKLHLALLPKLRNWGKPVAQTSMMLFDLQQDPGEKHDVAQHHPEVVERLLAQAQAMRVELGDLGMQGQGQRPAGWVEQTRMLFRDQ
ncbi:MAG: sulfatase family protein [Limisphaerales bacterium]